MEKAVHRKEYTRIVNFLAFAVRPFVRLQVQGLENIPESGGAILILNHISLLDPVLVGVALRKKRQVRALAKESLFRAPVIGGAMRSMGHIPVYRGDSRAKDALTGAVSALNSGELVGLYPEGTVPKELGQLGPFKTGAARLALESGAPVIPIVHWGAHRVFPKGKGKFLALVKAIFTRPVHKLIVGQPLQPFKGSSEDRAKVAEITAKLKGSIEILLPVIQ